MISLIRTKITNNTDQRLVFAGLLERPLVLMPKGNEYSTAIITGDIFSYTTRDIYCEPLLISMGNGDVTISYSVLPGIDTEVSYNDCVGGTARMRDSYNKLVERVNNKTTTVKAKPIVKEVELVKEVETVKEEAPVVEEAKVEPVVEEVKVEPVETVKEETKVEETPVVETVKEVKATVEETEVKPKKARKIKVN